MAAEPYGHDETRGADGSVAAQEKALALCAEGEARGVVTPGAVTCGRSEREVSGGRERMRRGRDRSGRVRHGNLESHPVDRRRRCGGLSERLADLA
ncbi:hypothetical protein [Streptomyces sp. G45]|uniref:hypothetical protein n=1 Tax=Streptomyces sp. G45 TaxID=3406627 RepID=UPI003C182430